MPMPGDRERREQEKRRQYDTSRDWHYKMNKVAADKFWKGSTARVENSAPSIRGGSIKSGSRGGGGQILKMIVAGAILLWLWHFFQ